MGILSLSLLVYVSILLGVHTFVQPRPRASGGLSAPFPRDGPFPKRGLEDNRTYPSRQHFLWPYFCRREPGIRVAAFGVLCASNSPLRCHYTLCCDSDSPASGEESRHAPSPVLQPIGALPTITPAS